MKIMSLAYRTVREIVRDPITIFFGVLFPVIMLVMFKFMGENVPDYPLFEPEKLTPGIAVFALSFIALFVASLISNDRESAFLERLYTTPLTAFDFIAGYLLPMLPLAAAQTCFCYFASYLLGFKVEIGSFLLLLLLSVPTFILFSSLGLFFGSVLGPRQVGGICGALMTTFVGWFSGIWFEVDLLGAKFGGLIKNLPFYRAVAMGRTVLSGENTGVGIDLMLVSLYAFFVLILAVLAFKWSMDRD